MTGTPVGRDGPPGARTLHYLSSHTRAIVGEP